MKLPMLEQDTANHAVYGAAIALAVMLAAAALKLPHAPLFGAGAAALFGVGKEAVDYLANRAAAQWQQPLRHGVEWADLAGTVAGGLVIALARMG